MSVYKEEKTGTWRVLYRYTDWTGEKKQTQKRGFKTKREAQAWEREQMNKVESSLDMTFESFVGRYREDKEGRIKENTWEMKNHIIETKLLPYFGKLKMDSITPQQIITWQNELLNYKDDKGKAYSPVYLKTVHNQLSAIFNHAVRYYNLRENPCVKAGSMGKAKADEMLIWTKDEYQAFSDSIMDNRFSWLAFQILFWTGIRIGELLALTFADIDLEKNIITVNKSYQYLNGKDVITPPKTPKSNRKVNIPVFLAEDIQDYKNSLYDPDLTDRVIPISKSKLEKEMQRGVKLSGVKKIRIHDLRHSHASLLIEMGFSPKEIAERLGHENIETTLNTYSHLYPDKQERLANRLDELYKTATLEEI